MLEIIPITALKDNYIWVLKNNKNRHAVIVDPSEPEPVLKFIKTEGLIPIAILITHHHWDHVGGIAGLISEYNLPVYAPKKEMVHEENILITEESARILTRRAPAEMPIILN